MRAMVIINGQQSRERAANWIARAPLGTRVEFKAPRRTLSQNDRMWAMLTDVSRQVEHCGRRYNPDEWKVIFLHACGRQAKFIPSLDKTTIIPWGQSSRDLSKSEMSELIECIGAWGAEHGVQFNDQGKQ